MTNQQRHQLVFPPILDEVRSALPAGRALYLVGGAVRDAIVGRKTHDLDFATPGDALKIAARVADRLGGAYYPLDETHPTGRVILQSTDSVRTILDFARFRGPDLESDLRARDFTINAMAVDVHAPQNLIDPLKGVVDLHQGVVQACSPMAFLQDPIRILRAVRIATGFDFSIHPKTRTLIRQAIPKLTHPSAERVRDELFRILEGRRPGTSIQALDYLGALPHLLPALEYLKGVDQPPPHISDVWSHSLRTMTKLELIIDVLGPVHDPDTHADLTMGLMSAKIGRFRTVFSAHLQTRFTPDRTLRPLLFLAALYHDVGKATTYQTDADGRPRFHRHAQVGVKIATEQARRLRLSNLEINRLATIVQHHMRPMHLAQTGDPPTRRAIYRFYRDTGPAGVDICLLTLADTLATYGPTLPQDTWIQQLSVIRDLLEAWWEEKEAQVDPPPLITGKDLINSLELQPGPQIGQLLANLKEAQACGLIKDREEALSYARQWLDGES